MMDVAVCGHVCGGFGVSVEYSQEVSYIEDVDNKSGPNWYWINAFKGYLSIYCFEVSPNTLYGWSSIRVLLFFVWDFRLEESDFMPQAII